MRKTSEPGYHFLSFTDKEKYIRDRLPPRTIVRCSCGVKVLEEQLEGHRARGGCR